MTDDINTATWRDIADQLTPPQIALLEGADGRMSVEDLRDIAIEDVSFNQLQDRYKHIAPPAESESFTAWFDLDEGGVLRTFRTREWPQVGDVTVRLGGIQHVDGRVERNIDMYVREHSDGELTAAQSRALAAVLVEAAAELDRLEGNDPPFM